MSSSNARFNTYSINFRLRLSKVTKRGKTRVRQWSRTKKRRMKMSMGMRKMDKNMAHKEMAQLARWRKMASITTQSRLRVYLSVKTYSRNSLSSDKTKEWLRLSRLVEELRSRKSRE
jgi:hypothetical protein